MARINKEKKIASVRRVVRGLSPFVVAEILGGVVAGITNDAIDAMDLAALETLGGPESVRNWLVALFRRPTVDPALATAAQLYVAARRAELRRLACLETHAVTPASGDDDRLASAIETALAAIRGGASCV